MIKAVVYTSNTGTTEQYAKMIGTKLGLPCYTLEKAKSELEKGTPIIYLGWIMASNIKGVKDANKLFIIKALCGVGMAKTGSQIDELTSSSKIQSDTKVFCFQGGFDIKKLSGIYKFMMNFMSRSVGKSLKNKENKTEEEIETLEMMEHGKNCVSEENLEPFYKWYSTQNK